MPAKKRQICTIGGRSFASKNYLHTHQVKCIAPSTTPLTKRPKIMRGQCALCNASFNTKSERDNHATENHPPMYVYTQLFQNI